MTEEVEKAETAKPEEKPTKGQVEATETRVKTLESLKTLNEAVGILSKTAQKAMELGPEVGREVVSAARDIVLGPKETPEKPIDVKVVEGQTKIIREEVRPEVLEAVGSAKDTANKAMAMVEKQRQEIAEMREGLRGDIADVKLTLSNLAKTIQTNEYLLREVSKLREKVDEADKKGRPYVGRIRRLDRGDEKVEYELLPEDERDLHFQRLSTRFRLNNFLKPTLSSFAFSLTNKSLELFIIEDLEIQLHPNVYGNPGFFHVPFQVVY
jgi:hypothetical protein